MVELFETAEKLGFKNFSESPERLVYEEWNCIPVLYKGVADLIEKGSNLNQIEKGICIFQLLVILS